MWWVCDGCDKIWRARLMACPGCRRTPLRPFGSHESDAEHAMAARVPLRCSRGPGAEVSSSPRPSVRAPVADWRAWAVSVGHDPDVVADTSKADLQSLDPAVLSEAV